MTKPYQGGGKLTTRLLGRLEILHGEGTIEFRLRSPMEIQKRGVRVVLRIEGLPDIPRIEDGTSILIDMEDRSVRFEKENESEVHFDRQDRSRRTA